jgi:hypothetical protein
MHSVPIEKIYAMKTPFGLLLLTTIWFPCHAMDVYKWTDAKGQVHYGDAVPEGKASSAKGISVKGGPVSEADRKAATERLAKYREDLVRASPETAAAPAATTPKPRKTPCEEAWDAYNESYACFDPYRMGKGTIRLEAFQGCKEVNRPPEACR